MPPNLVIQPCCPPSFFIVNTVGDMSSKQCQFHQACHYCCLGKTSLMTEGHYTATSGLRSGWNIPSGTFFGYTGVSCSVGFKRNERRKHPDVLTSQHSMKSLKSSACGLDSGSKEMALSLMKLSYDQRGRKGSNTGARYICHHYHTIMWIVHYVQ